MPFARTFRAVAELSFRGCTLLRGAVDPGRIADAVDRCYSEQDSGGATRHEREYDLGLLDIQTLLERGGIDPHRWSHGEGLAEIAHAFFLGRAEPYNTCARRVEAGTPYSVGAGWHVDADPLNSLRVALNFWIPTRDCGPRTDAPAIVLVPASTREMQRYVGFDPALASDADRADKRLIGGNRFFRNKTWNADLARFARRKWTPTLRRGDVLVFTSWCLHATHTEPGMTAQRRSLELRFEEAEPGWIDLTHPARHLARVARYWARRPGDLPVPLSTQLM